VLFGGLLVVNLCFWTFCLLNNLCFLIYHFNWRFWSNLDSLIINWVWTILGSNSKLGTTDSGYVRRSVWVGGDFFLLRFGVFQRYYTHSQPTNMIWFLRLGLGLVAAFADGRSVSIRCLGVPATSSTLSWFSIWTWQSSC